METLKNNNLIVGIVTTIVIILIIGGLLFMQHDVNKKKEKELKETSTNAKKEETENKQEEDVTQDINYLEVAKEQLAEPKEGEVKAIMHIKGKGEIHLKFFKEDAPKAVENFITHSKNGYYNNLTFHRVIEDFMIQGGDPTGTGTGGESIWKEDFEKEVNLKRFPFRGSLAMASTSLPKSLSSQFFIVQANANQQILNSLTLQNVNKTLIDAYKEFGGYPSLFMQYTVFGQVYKGMEIVDEIAKTKTDSSDKPLEDVIIEKIEVIEG